MSGASWYLTRWDSKAELLMVSVYSRGSVPASRTAKVYSRSSAFELNPTYCTMTLSIKESNFQMPKKKGGPELPARPAQLEAGYVRRLHTLGAGDHFKLNGLTLVEGPVSVALDR